MEQNRNDSSRNGPGKNGDDKRKPNLFIALIIAVVVVLLISSIFNMISKSQYTLTTLSDFFDELEANNLSEVVIHYDRIVYLTKEEAAKPAEQQKAC